MSHQVGETVRDRVQLVLGGLVIARLAVLEHGDEQERDDRRGGVDLELVLGIQESRGIAVYQDVDEALDQPHDHQEHADREERSTAREARGPAREAVEEPDPGRHVRRHQHRLFLHLSSYQLRARSSCSPKGSRRDGDACAR